MVNDPYQHIIKIWTESEGNSMYTKKNTMSWNININCCPVVFLYLLLLSPVFHESLLELLFWELHLINNNNDDYI